MTTTISPDEYCKDPSKYKNFPGLDEKTLQYWDQYCSIKDSLNTDTDPINYPGLAKAELNAVGNLFKKMVSPQSLALLGGIIGGKVLYKYIGRAIGAQIKKGLEDETLELAENFIIKGGSGVVANGAILTSETIDAISFASIDVASVAGYSMGKYGVALIFDGLGSIFSFAATALLILQIIGLLLDTWDPCNLNTMLDDSQFRMFNEQFNFVFRDQLLQNIETTTDSYGRTLYSSIWPVEYYPDQSILIPYKKDYYKQIHTNLMFSYLNSLQTNSCGMPIEYVKGGKVVSKYILRDIDNEFALFLSDDNTIVANWMEKYWPLIVVGIILLIVIFLIIKK